VDLVKVTSDFEKELVETMILENCTMQEALVNLFSLYRVDTESVIDLVDFLEYMVYDLDKVQYLMQIYTGQVPDMQLVDLKDEKKKDRDKG
jgi:hypothetical protein